MRGDSEGHVSDRGESPHRAPGGRITGLLGVILGAGGGVFPIPMLVLVLKVPMHYAVATSIVTVITTSTAVASTNVERGTANMRLGMVLEIATTLGAISSGVTAGWLSARAMEGLFAAVLVPTALAMGKGRGEDRAGAAGELDFLGEESLGSLGARYCDEAEGREVAYRVRRIRAGLGISFLAGNLSGLLGIGGGTFKVPALNILCGVPIKAAAATSNFMIGVTAAASAFLYYNRARCGPP